MTNSQVIEIELDAIAHGGAALGHHNGKVVFVQGAIPGELARVRIAEERKRWARAELMDVLRTSPSRVDPPCPHFGVCGGCQWQHIRYEAQLEFKRQVVVNQLQRLGRLESPAVLPVLGAAEPRHYRNHVQFGQNARGRLGFRAAQSHDVIPVERCLLLHPLLDEVHSTIGLDSPELRRLSLRAGIRTSERMVIVETLGDRVPELNVGKGVACIHRLSDGSDVSLTGHTAYHERLLDKRYRVSAGSFFQVNTEQAEAVLGVVREYVAPSRHDVLLDAYCGVGTLGLSVEADLGRLIGIEEHPAAVTDARKNAQGVGHATFLQGKAEMLVPALEEGISKVVVDPPRQGCKTELIEALVRLAPRRIVYVSCDPATLARDGAKLARSGYELVQVQPVDMFPQTYHIETISLWRRTKRRTERRTYGAHGSSKEQGSCKG